MFACQSQISLRKSVSAGSRHDDEKIFPPFFLPGSSGAWISGYGALLPLPQQPLPRDPWLSVCNRPRLLRPQ